MTNTQIIGQAFIEAVSFTLFLILLFGATYFIGEVFRHLWKNLTKKLVQHWTSCTYKKRKSTHRLPSASAYSCIKQLKIPLSSYHKNNT